MTLTNEQAIEQIAIVCHEANRTFCAVNNDYSQVEWLGSPEWQRQSAINGVLFHMQNPHAQPQDSHNSWLKEKYENGWRYGETKNPGTKEHPCCVPYSELPVEQQLKDYIFGGIAKAMISKFVAADILTYERQLTPGEAVMSVGFNPGQREDVRVLKAKYAELYDLISSQLINKDPITGCMRLAAIAKTELETSQMYSVKAVTRN